MHLVVITVVNKDEIIKKNSHVVSSANSTELARLILHLGNDNVYLLCFFFKPWDIMHVCMKEREIGRTIEKSIVLFTESVLSIYLFIKFSLSYNDYIK